MGVRYYYCRTRDDPPGADNSSHDAYGYNLSVAELCSTFLCSFILSVFPLSNYLNAFARQLFGDGGSIRGVRGTPIASRTALKTSGMTAATFSLTGLMTALSVPLILPQTLAGNDSLVGSIIDFCRGSTTWSLYCKPQDPEQTSSRCQSLTQVRELRDNLHILKPVLTSRDRVSH